MLKHAFSVAANLLTASVLALLLTFFKFWQMTVVMFSAVSVKLVKYNVNITLISCFIHNNSNMQQWYVTVLREKLLRSFDSSL